MQDTLHKPDSPHALWLWVPVPQPARPWELGCYWWQQNRPIVLRGDLHGLLAFVLRHTDVQLRHGLWETELWSKRNQLVELELLVNTGMMHTSLKRRSSLRFTSANRVNTRADRTEIQEQSNAVRQAVWNTYATTLSHLIADGHESWILFFLSGDTRKQVSLPS